MQLKDKYYGWNGLNEGIQREEAIGMSIVEGQGMLKCNCRGKCNTKSCKCCKADQICNYPFCKGNERCTNQDQKIIEGVKRVHIALYVHIVPITSSQSKG